MSDRPPLRIVLVGYTGAGKSTFIGSMGFDSPISHSAFSERGGVQMYECNVTIDGKEYILQIIDSIGLGDAGGKDGEPPLTEAEVRQALGTFLQEQGITHVNLVLWAVKEDRASGDLVS